jgi:pyridinium-3,5-biscarboxylic acid mononucleotide sulfurtransferase
MNPLTVLSSPAPAPLTALPVAGASADLDEKVARLRRALQEMERVLVCFSAGVDSAYLLAEAANVLGEGAVAFTAVSPSYPDWELASGRAITERLGVRHEMVETAEVDDPRYAANPVNRCYFCKSELFERAARAAEALGIRFILDGFNADDRGDHRPGRKAGQERAIRSPLDEVGMTKADVREAARRLGVEVWDKPALACLSSRFPYGTEITPERLAQVARSEAALRELGFRVFRVRYHGEVARVEVAPEELDRMLSPKVREAVTAALKAAGFAYVAVDLEGYRTGAMNETLGRR